MRRSALIAMFMLLAALVACGGDDGGTPVDAPKAIDAAIDAPAPLVGLGQKCGTGQPACPTNAPLCVGFTGSTQYCSANCLMDGTGMTNANGQFTSITPAPNHATCTGAFTGTVGTAQCLVFLSITPMHSMIMPNTTYTNINLACQITCGTGSTCPSGMACDVAKGNICLPM